MSEENKKIVRRWFEEVWNRGSESAIEEMLDAEGVAHGFLTLEPGSDVLYQIAPAYASGHAAGVRWNDPAFAIAWPATPALMSPADAAYPDYNA